MIVVSCAVHGSTTVPSCDACATLPLTRALMLTANDRWSLEVAPPEVPWE